jgi:dethiobiotin synthetase
VKGYFVTGTGTGVGKTFVACQLARCARALGKRVFAFKPIETGCQLDAGRLVGADQQLLCEAAGDWQREQLRGLYQFEPPVAPLVAAERDHSTIDIDAVVQTVAQGSVGVDLVIVEGAGGWRVPITTSCDIAKLASQVGLPIMVVAQATLGTINHSLLTLEAIERDGQNVAALVLSRRPEDDEEQAVDNARRIAARWAGTVLIHRETHDLSVLV